MAKRSAARKKTAKVRISHHLKKPLASVLKEAKSLKGKVVEQAALDKLISNLEAVQTSAAADCPYKVWYRSFTIRPTAAKKR